VTAYESGGVYRGTAPALCAVVPTPRAGARLGFPPDVDNTSSRLATPNTSRCSPCG
jgi:hypothetical protein